MDLTKANALFEITDEAAQFGGPKDATCKFEITQANSTFKLRKLSTSGSFKIKLKPIYEQKSEDNLKKTASRLSRDNKKFPKRSLEAVYGQEEFNLLDSDSNLESESEKKIKKSKPLTIKLRKSSKNYEQSNKSSNLTNNIGAQDVQVQGLPKLKQEEIHILNIDNFIESPGKLSQQRCDNTLQNAPQYIKNIYKEVSTQDEESKKKFFASFKHSDEKKHKETFDFPKLPIDFSLPQSEKLGESFVYDLDIVTNDNKKERIKVSFNPGKVDMFNEVPNRMDKEARDSFFRGFNFTMDYRSGYAPIDVQAIQEKEFSYKDHFIKKKQSCANTSLKRVCGVSYVKKLELHQLNVNNIFAKLNPLVFQGSTGCVRLPEYQSLMKASFDSIFEERVEADDESLMREYLYFPERRMRLTGGKVYLVSSLDSLWQFFRDKQFVCVHLLYNEKDFITKPEIHSLSPQEIEKALSKSNVQIGFLCKKGLSGKKAFLKTFTEGLYPEGQENESESEDETHPQNVEEENRKIKIREKLTLIKERKRKEKRELREKKREERKKAKMERLLERQMQKESQKDQKNKEKKEKKKEASLTNKQLHFFDKAKLKLEKNNIFQAGIMNDFFSNVNEIMLPYLKMLFVKDYKLSHPNTLPKSNTVVSSVFLNESKNEPQTYQTPVNLTQDNDKLETCSNSPIPPLTENITNGLEQEKILDIAKLPGENFKELEDEKEIKEIEIEVQAKLFDNKQDDELIDQCKKEDNLNETATQEVKIEDKQISSEKANNYIEPKICEILKNSGFSELIKEIKKDANKNLITMSTRVELYTHEESWKSADSHTKNLLYTFVLHITDVMIEKFRNWSLKRSDIAKGISLPDKKNNIYLYEFDANKATVTKNLDMKPENLNWHFDPQIKSFDNTMITESGHFQSLKVDKLKPVSLADLQGTNDFQKETSQLSLPLYLINTRDSFAFDLIEKVSEIEMQGRKVIKTDYYFDPNAYPSNFKSFVDKFPDYYVGVTTYNNFFSHEELCQIEEKCYETEKKFFKNHFLPMTGQMTCASDKVRRTKFFFGARYIWTKQQLSEPHSMVGAGIRVDVSEPPSWMKDLVENQMVQAGIMEKDFVNSIAMNVYHDGKEGLAQHFDDAVRFKQPIYTLRIFSDSRLSFGSQFYGFCNGAFCIPMPRGCITVLAEESYAANGIKHCVRPCDMTGKSAALILRQMHHKVFNEAKLYDEFVDFPTWFSTLSIKDNAVSYSDQKRIEAEESLKSKKKPDE